MGLLVLLAQRDGNLAVAEDGIHGRAQREAGDEPPAAEDVQHGELFGHADGRIVEREAVAQHHDGGVGRVAGHGRGHQVGRGHQAVGVGVVFVDADAVETHGLGELQLVQVVGIEPVALGRVEQRVGHIHPYAVVILFKVGGQPLVGHEVEKAQLHNGTILRRAFAGFYTERERPATAALRTTLK